MKRSMSRILCLLIVMGGCGGGISSPPQWTRNDHLPMYGGMNRSVVPELKATDEKLIAETSRHYGSRTKAAEALVDQGFRFYYQDDLTRAMRCFNQAWLLDPKNPEVYWGFGSILHDQEKMCEAMTHFETAVSAGRYIHGLYPDAGRVISLCGVQNIYLTPETRQNFYNRSDALYTEAVEKDQNKGYVYASWASAYYWRENYVLAWAMVKRAREAGGQIPPQFLSMLRSKMAEP